MNLYSAAQIKEWDAFTIAREPIAPIDLMERAATQCVQWLLQNLGPQYHYVLVCGKGNNGGDGLAIARLLHLRGIAVTVYILEFGHLGSEEFQENLQRLHQYNIQPHFIQGAEGFPLLQENDVVVDALFGSGLNRPLSGLAAGLVQHLNKWARHIVSVDVPSGLLLDATSKGQAVIQAQHTLSFQATKMAFLLPENEMYVGQVAVLDIKLHKDFGPRPPYVMMDAPIARSIYRPRSRFGHKGNYGHVLLVGGSIGKIGAMALAAKASLRAGAGLCSVLVPRIGYYVLQTAVAEAMCLTDAGEERLTNIGLDTSPYSAIGIGPGMGTAAETLKAFTAFVSRQERLMVVDADALNCLAQEPALLSTLPKGSILTPHPKEFERLFGVADNDFERIEMARKMARQFGCYIILKGHHSFIAAPDGDGYFNSTGNAGMATGGSGDVLTGIVTALLAQGYTSLQAALLGVYIHGLAGDAAARSLSQEALVATDITEHLGHAFRQLHG